MVPESVLKKRKRDEQWAKNRAEQLQKAEAKAKENKEVIFKRAEQYIAEYRQQVENLHGIPDTFQAPFPPILLPLGYQ